MKMSWRHLGYGGLLGGLLTASGCVHGWGCGPACSTCEPVCEPACEAACEPVCTAAPACVVPCGGLRNAGWSLTGWLHRRSNAIPESLPLGKVNEAWYYEMQTNAEASDFIIHDLDFVGQTVELTSDGKDHILEIAARMPSTPFPVIVERSPNNADPELDLARRNLVVQILSDLGSADAAQRVVVSTPYGPGYWSPQAQQMYFRHALRGGGFGGGLGGFGGGGFGGGIGGGGGGIGGGF